MATRSDGRCGRLANISPPPVWRSSILVADLTRSDTISEYRQVGRSSVARPSSQLKFQPSIGASCASTISCLNEGGTDRSSHLAADPAGRFVVLATARSERMSSHGAARRSFPATSTASKSYEKSARRDRLSCRASACITRLRSSDSFLGSRFKRHSERRVEHEFPPSALHQGQVHPSAERMAVTTGSDTEE